MHKHWLPYSSRPKSRRQRKKKVKMKKKKKKRWIKRQTLMQISGSDLLLVNAIYHFAHIFRSLQTFFLRKIVFVLFFRSFFFVRSKQKHFNVLVKLSEKKIDQSTVKMCIFIVSTLGSKWTDEYWLRQCLWYCYCYSSNAMPND